RHGNGRPPRRPPAGPPRRPPESAGSRPQGPTAPATRSGTPRAGPAGREPEAPGAGGASPSWPAGAGPSGRPRPPPRPATGRAPPPTTRRAGQAGPRRPLPGPPPPASRADPPAPTSAARPLKPLLSRITGHQSRSKLETDGSVCHRQYRVGPGKGQRGWGCPDLGQPTGARPGVSRSPHPRAHWGQPPPRPTREGTPGGEGTEQVMGGGHHGWDGASAPQAAGQAAAEDGAGFGVASLGDDPPPGAPDPCALRPRGRPGPSG